MESALATRRYDIVVCSHSGAFAETQRLLPKLRPHGAIHLVSSYLQASEIRSLEPWIDFLHEPNHESDGYRNFKLFCIRDLVPLVTAPHFIKIDTDVELRSDWIAYVDEMLEARPDSVLFGTHSGTNLLDYDIDGTFVRRRLGRPVQVREAVKVNGSFYVGQTRFFREHHETMMSLHEALYAFRGGVRVRPALSLASQQSDGVTDVVRLRGSCRGKEGALSEDELRSLLVHHVGASDRLAVHDSHGRVSVPDKAERPSRWKLAWKRIKRLLGVPVYVRERRVACHAQTVEKDSGYATA